MRYEVVVEAERRRFPVQVDTTDAAATVGDLRVAVDAHLAAEGVAAVAGSDLWCDGRRLDTEAPLGDTAVVDGALLHVRAPFATKDPDVAAVRVDVVGGLEAGRSTSLEAGRPVRVGRRRDCELDLPDPEVSREHLLVDVDDAGVFARDLGSSNGVAHRGHRFTDDTTITGDDVLTLGESAVAARAGAEVAADVHTVRAEGNAPVRAFNRPPRMIAHRAPVDLVVPVAPSPPRGFRFPWPTVFLPLLLGGVLFLVMPRYGSYLIIMMAMSPLMAIATLVNDRSGGRKEHKQAMARYRADAEAHTAALEAATVVDEVVSRRELPDPAQLLRRAGRPGGVPEATLWQRRRGDADFLRLRVGLADRPAAIVLHKADGPRLRGAGQNGDPLTTPPLAHDVPVVIDLQAVRVLGVAGPRETVLPVARALVVQCATLFAPADLQIVVVTGSDDAADWEWASWLPHTRGTTDSSGVGGAPRLFAVEGSSAADRVGELRRLVEERTATARSALANGAGDTRRVLLVLDGSRRLRSLPGLAGLLAAGPAVGVHALCLDTDPTALPDECGAFVVAHPDTPTRARLEVTGVAPVEDVLLDGVPVDLAARAAQALAPLVALGEAGGAAELPDTVRFAELANAAVLADAERADGTDDAAVARVLAAWGDRPERRSTEALIGVGPDGPLTIDLVADGPHTLVTGTSGAGKSELLQTLVGSLAMANPPDAMNFVLVDYKGGAAFAACADLPHCVGMVTDLDGHLARRALDSLGAELTRREHLLGGAGSKDIDDYWARTGDRLPRLVVVVDEFATLVEEVPEFVPGVVGIGMRGRSLGVHVVLATQRPGGVVSADLRANVNCRISLRVTSESESLDVIDDPAAARIPPRRPGRAYLRTGHGRLTPFQAARVGWPHAPRAVATDGRPRVTVTTRALERLVREAPAAAADPAGSAARTDLDVLVAAAAAAAVRDGLPAPRRPWLPPLAPLVAAETDWDVEPGVAGRATLGIVDRPDVQAQQPFVLDLAATGPLVIAGAVRAGRTTALRTLAASLTRTTSPADLHLHVLDFGGGGLASLAALPHTGAVVDGSDDEDRVPRLLAKLTAEIATRQRVLAAGGFASVAEQRGRAAAGEALPVVVLLIDRLEGFVARYGEVDGGRTVDLLESLLRVGPSAGVHVVLSTDRTGFTHRIASAVGARLVLRQATTDDVASFGLDPRAVPEEMPAGRALWSPDGTAVHEVQVAVLGGDPAGAAQTDAVLALAADLAGRWDGLPAAARAPRLDRLPEQVAAADLVPSGAPASGPRGTVTPGVGGDDLTALTVDLDAVGGSFLICGPARSGRSTALVSALTGPAALPGLAAGTLAAVVLSPRPSPVRALGEADGVAAVLTGDADEMAPRLRDLLNAHDEAGVDVALVVDDGELLAVGAVAAMIEAHLASVREGAGLLIVAATTEDVLTGRYRGWLAGARRERCGVLLQPGSAVDGEAFDLRLPRSTRVTGPVGRGLLVVHGEATPVQLAAPVACEQV